MSPIGRFEPWVITERRQVDPGAHDRSKSRGNDHGGQCTALQQRGRRSVRPKPTAVDDHINIDIAQPVESLGQVFPHSTEMRRTARLGETGQEEPATLLLRRQWQRLVKNRLSKRATITVCLGYA